MSSRNALLSTDERKAAPSLHAILRHAAGEIGDGKAVEETISRAIRELQSKGFGPVDYLAYVDGGSLEPLTDYRDGGRLIVAAFLGTTRLIDNIRVVSATASD